LGKTFFLETQRYRIRAIFSARPKLFFPPTAVLAWLHTTDLSNAFDSIWHSALFCQLIVLGLSLSFVVYICSFLSDRWSRNNFCVAGSRSFFDILQGFVPFTLFVLLIDDLTETFATRVNSTNVDTSLFGLLLQTHSKSWKDYNKPSYLHRHKVKHSVFISNLFEMQFILQVGPPSMTLNLFSTPFLLKIRSCNF